VIILKKTRKTLLYQNLQTLSSLKEGTTYGTLFSTIEVFTTPVEASNTGWWFFGERQRHPIYTKPNRIPGATWQTSTWSAVKAGTGPDRPIVNLLLY
jgi:hypothetical protein